MEYYEYFLIGYKSIKQHKLRSLLTTLGVIFGVAAVIAMMSIAGGARKSAIEQIKLLGTNNIRIKQLELTGEKKAEAELRGSPGLCVQDADLIQKVVPEVEAVSPLKYIDVDVFYHDHKSHGLVVGTNRSYSRVANFYPARGRFITDLDVLEARRVCVLGAEVAKLLFQFRDPID